MICRCEENCSVFRKCGTAQLLIKYSFHLLQTPLSHSDNNRLQSFSSSSLSEYERLGCWCTWIINAGDRHHVGNSCFEFSFTRSVRPMWWCDKRTVWERDRLVADSKMAKVKKDYNALKRDFQIEITHVNYCKQLSPSSFFCEGLR